MNELGAVKHSVWEIILHPHWDPEESSYDADIAILALRSLVEFIKNKIDAICLPEPFPEDVFGIGVVVGWGRSEKARLSSTPKQLIISVVNQSHCFEANENLEAASSHRTFCAGFLNQSKATCDGDSGSGYYQYDAWSKTFVLTGVVSAAVIDYVNFLPCDIQLYTIFTKVVKFVKWMKKQMDATKQNRWIDVEFECEPLIYRGEK